MKYLRDPYSLVIAMVLYKLQMAVKPIPEARLELARLQSTDFKSVASTDSATQVIRGEATKRGDLCQLLNEKPQKSLKPAQVSPDEVLLRTH